VGRIRSMRRPEEVDSSRGRSSVELQWYNNDRRRPPITNASETFALLVLATVELDPSETEELCCITLLRS
jgi:hypothetical protein